MQTRTLWITCAALLAIAGVAAYLYYVHPAVETEPPVLPPAPEVDLEPGIRHPIPEIEPAPEEPPEPLPDLDQSDQALQESITGLVGQEGTQRLSLSEGIIRRIVATIDNLPREKLALKLRPVAAVGGRFRVEGDEQRMILSAENYSRYEPLVQLVAAIPAEQLAALYFRYYPLFQQAYEDLGYPTGYFNDRLIEVIDHLLATPEVAPPIELARPHVLYQFADPDLEARSAGQKILIRMGAANAALIKQKLRELRDRVAATPPTAG